MVAATKPGTRLAKAVYSSRLNQGIPRRGDIVDDFNDFMREVNATNLASKQSDPRLTYFFKRILLRDCVSQSSGAVNH